MRVQFYLQDRPAAVAWFEGDQLKVKGHEAGAVKQLIEGRRERYGAWGEELLRLLTTRLSGMWSAEEIDDGEIPSG